MRKRKLRKKPVTLAASALGGVQDKRSRDLLRNAEVAEIEVDDPGELVYIGRGQMGRARPDGKLVLLRSLRDDPLASMHHAQQLDDAQFLAGRHWQRMRALCQLGGVSAIDPAKEAVDGGKMPEPISDVQIQAFKELDRAVKALGQEGNALVVMFLDKGLTLKIIAYRWGYRTARERGYIGYRLRECLDTLAFEFGYANRVIHRHTQDMVEAI